VCNPASGACSNPTKPDGTACDDSNGCTQTDTCQAGACTGANTIACPAPDACHLAGTCDKTTGLCSNSPAADGTACNDQNACTRIDTCHGGACVGASPVDCSVPDACHLAGACAPATGLCSNPPKPNPFFDRIFEVNSYRVSAGPIYELSGGTAKTKFATVSGGSLGWIGPIQITASGRMWIVSSALGGSLWDITAGGDFTGATPFAQNIFGTDVFIDGFDLDAQGNAYVAYSENGLQPLAIVAPNGTVTHTTTKYNNAASLLVAEGRSCSPGRTLYISEGGAGRVLSHDLLTGVDTVLATGFNPGRDHVSGELVMAAQTQLLVLWSTSAGTGLFDITAGGDFTGRAPLVTAPFRIDVNQCAINSAGSMFCAGNDSGNSYVSTRQNGVQQPFTVFETGIGDTEAVAIGPAVGVGAAGAQPNVSINAPSHIDVGMSVPLVGTVTENGLPPGNLTYSWTLVTGPGAVTFTAPTALTTGASFGAPGSYLIQLGATDGVTSGLAQAQIGVGPNQPPVVSAGDNFTATTPAQAVQLHGVASDDGLPVGSTLTLLWTTLSGPTQATFVNPTSTNATVSFPAAGIYQLELSASDSQYVTTSVVTATIVAQNQPPAIVSVAAPTQVAFNAVAPLSAVVTDDGLPVGSTLSLQWAQIGGPGAVIFSAPTQAQTDVTFGGVPGTYVLQLSASDGQLTTTATVTITVLSASAVDQPPVVSAGPNLTLTEPATNVALNGTVTDDGLPPGVPLRIEWVQMAGPATVQFADPTQAATTATFPAAGQYTLWLTASDSAATSIASVYVVVSPPAANQAPVVNAGPDQTITAPTMSTTLAGTATDNDGLPVGATLSYSWSVLLAPAAVTMATPNQATTPVTFSYPGVYQFQLAVSDTDKVGTATVTVTVNPPSTASTGAPSVSMSGIADDALITKPTQVLGNVSEGSWALEYRLGGRDDVQTVWSALASGTGAVTSAVLGTLDPTLLLNGIYTVRLSATTSAGSSSTSFSVSVDGRMKVGNFTLTFTDLETAVTGIPFRIDRVYDSRDKSVGDFGVGWKLAISDVRVEKSGKTGAYWTQVLNDQGFFPQYCLEPAHAASVTVTFPGGREYRFQAKSSPECQALEPLTTPDIVWQSTSDPNNPTITLVAQGGTSVFTQSTVGPVQLLTASQDIWDPRQFTLTIEDGSVFQISQDTGVTQVADRHGNTLSITAAGIVHSSGKQVRFQRDAQNRITQITDPAGKSMTYAYIPSGDLASYTDRAGNTTQFAYSGNHYLDDIQDPLGRHPVRSSYDASGRLVSQTDAAGNTVAYNHDVTNSQDAVTDRLGHVTLYQYNDRGDITQKTDATGAVWKYTFDIFGNKLSETNPLGVTTSSTFNGQNVPVTQTDALGNVTSYAYNSFRQVVTTTDPLGHVTTNVYDGFGSLTSTSDALGNVTKYTYNNFGNVNTQTDPLGNVTSYLYDLSGNVTQTTDALGHVTSGTYDANGKKLSETVTQTIGGTAQSLTTSYQYDSVERLLKTTYPDGASRSTGYTLTGKRATETDELGRVTTYTYDALDRLVTTTRPDGSSESQTYDAENRRASSTDAAGNTTSYAYDNVGRLTTTTFADGSVAATTYDAAGRATATTDELGHVTQTTYDAAGRRTSTTDPIGAITRAAYDAAGNVTGNTDALGHVTSMAYDADNRPVSTTYADGTSDSMAYDAAGRMVSKTDALGRVTHFAYDAVGRLVSVTDALGQITRYAYDEVGHRVSQTDANGHTTSFAYDARGRETGRTLPDGATETKAYDAAGEMVTRTDFAGRATAYGYDAMGRLSTRTYPDASLVVFAYTPDGRRATEADARGTTTYAYDARRRMVQETYPDGRVLSFAYDAHGERTGLTAKIGVTSLTTTTSYDAAGRPGAVTDPIGRGFGLTYDANGNRAAIQYPNTTSTAYTYDALNRLTSLTTTQTPPSPAPPVTLQSYAYTLDAAGKRTGIAENGGTTRAYAYDGIDRLTSETVTGALSYAKTFAYDAVGNRSAQTTTGTGAASVNYAYDTRDRLTTENTTNYSYDANGNVTSKSGEANYTWDVENRLTRVAMTGGGTVDHVYDAEGSRVKTTVTPSSSPATVTNYLVDTSGGLSQVVAETDGSGNLGAYYVRVGNELLAVMRPGATPGTWSTRFVHGDGLGSVRVLTDETGATIDQRAYEAFGTKNVEAGSDPLAYGFAGEPFEGTTRLAYHRARWMDARVGRFVGMDRWRGIPEAPATLHRYSYVWNGPTNGTDPSGLTSPINFVIGRAVHDAIATDFLESDTPKLTYPKYSDRAIYDLVASSRPDLASNWVYKVIWGVGLLARPDLSAPNEHVIFEVKSVDDSAEGESKVLSYLELLNYLDPTGNWTAGSADQFTPHTPITVSGYPVEVAPPVGGLILYTIGGETRRSIAAAIAAAAAVGIVALTFGPVAGVAGTAGF
jgi:RHS repeat-associated protein